MGTRGILGVRYNGEDKITYNHYDSYPEALGANTVQHLYKMLNAGSDMALMFNEMQAVNNDTKPTQEQIKHCRPWTDLTVSNQSTDDWYCLLRGTQGDLQAFMDAKYYSDDAKFAHDSLFCEWGYIANLDEQVLEVYKGFQTKKGIGRYTKKAKKDSEYFGISLVLQIPFAEIKEQGNDPQLLLEKVIGGDE